MNYRESLTVQAFNQMERLKQRIDRQEYTDAIKRKRQYCRVTEPLKQTQLMRDVEEEHEILRLQQERLKEEAKTNPDVILSPRDMAEKCMKKITDFPGMFQKYKEMPEEELAEWVTPEMLDEIDYAMVRQEGLGIPMW